MPTYRVTPALKGLVSAEDLLKTNRTLSFHCNKKNLLEDDEIFLLESKGFLFSLSTQNTSLVFKRNETKLVLPLNNLPDGKSIGVYATWDINKLQLNCIYGSNVQEQIKCEVFTYPVAPPSDLIKWSRKCNLLPQEEYQCEEDFGNKVHSCLLSIQEKIHQTGSYYQFWNIQYEGQKILKRTPKYEVEVQPIIHSLLSDQFLMASIEIIPEYNSGVGDLDFLFIGKIKNNGFGYFCAEFKRAHSDKLKEGLTNQLPTYMESKTAKYGAYCVLNYYGDWLKTPEKFKDKNLDFELELMKLESKNPYLLNTRIFIYNLSRPVSASKK